MKKEKALALLENFPEITPQMNKEMRNLLRQYLVVSRDKKGYCTSCEQIFGLDNLPPHRSETFCPNCAEPVQCISKSHNFCGSVVEDMANAVIMLSSPNDDNLYVRCFALRLYFKHGELIPNITVTETQRYVFTETQSARYGKNHYWVNHRGSRGDFTYYTKEYEEDWTVRTKVTEPQFGNYGNYSLICADAVQNTCMRYSELANYPGRFPIAYLKFYQRHRGAERLIKCGLGSYVERAVEDSYHTDSINWNETEVHKMLGVPCDVCRRIRAGDISLGGYRTAAEYFKNVPLDQLIQYHSVVEYSYGLLESAEKMLCVGYTNICKYLLKQRIKISDFQDYLRVCKDLNYDFQDRSAAFPKDFVAAHDRVHQIQRAIREEREAQKRHEEQKTLKKKMKAREKLEYANGNLLVRQPKSVQEIVDEGRALSHCVGGYASRHARGELNIMFLRKADEPDKPYYTVEVSTDYRIIQCRGYKNNWESAGGTPKPQEIIDFEKEYQAYLDTLKNKKARKTA